MSKFKAIINASQIATPIGRSSAKGSEMNNLKVIENAGIIIEDETILFVGTSDEVKSHPIYTKIEEKDIFDAKDRLITPGFIDSHTHFVFGGNRADEFNMRLAGASYMDIMASGGGIQSSVNATREISFDDLYSKANETLENMLLFGVTTVEGKSGYGLDSETEMKQLEVLKKLNENNEIDVVSTYMGAHSVPKEMKGEGRKYLESLYEGMEKIKKEDLAEFCDIFCEDKVFSVEDSRDYLLKAREMGFKLKMHADEIVDIGGGKLAGELSVTSADHLLVTSDESIESMKDSGVVANLLPATAFSLREEYASARKMIDRGLAVSIATDYNPGSSPTYSIPLIISLATLNMNMTVEETITALTLNAAAALDRAERVGSIEEGKKADILIHRVKTYREIPYNIALTTVEDVFKNGELIVRDGVRISKKYESLSDYPIKSFMNVLASKSPTPGGGSAAALGAVTGAALFEMVISLTIGKKKYADVEEDLQKMLPLIKSLRYELTTLIDEDAKSFESVMSAFRLPKEAENRKEEIEKSLINAMNVPLKIAEKSVELIRFSVELADKGNENAVTDVVVGAMNIRTAVISAIYNVIINLNSLSSDMSDVKEKIQLLEQEVIDTENRVRSIVDKKLEM